MGRTARYLIFAAALFALAFAAAPWFAFRALRANAQDQDLQGLVAVVDYPAVRASLRAQLAAEPPPPPQASVWRDPVGALRQAIEPFRPAPPSLDRHLSPDGLYRLTLGQDPDAPSDLAAGAPWPGLRYWDLGRARFSVRPKGGTRGPTLFTFERRGLFAWTLVQIRLPDATTPEPRSQP